MRDILCHNLCGFYFITFHQTTDKVGGRSASSVRIWNPVWLCLPKFLSFSFIPEPSKSLRIYSIGLSSNNSSSTSALTRLDRCSGYDAKSRWSPTAHSNVGKSNFLAHVLQRIPRGDDRAHTLHLDDWSQYWKSFAHHLVINVSRVTRLTVLSKIYRVEFRFVTSACQ